jgi:hypothetical protein
MPINEPITTSYEKERDSRSGNHWTCGRFDLRNRKVEYYNSFKAPKAAEIFFTVCWFVYSRIIIDIFCYLIFQLSREYLQSLADTEGYRELDLNQWEFIVVDVSGVTVIKLIVV